MLGDCIDRAPQTLIDDSPICVILADAISEALADVSSGVFGSGGGLSVFAHWNYLFRECLERVLSELEPGEMIPDNGLLLIPGVGKAEDAPSFLELVRHVSHVSYAVFCLKKNTDVQPARSQGQ